MDLSSRKWRILTAILCFIIMAFCIRTAKAALDETTKTQPLSSGINQERDAAMDDFMRKIDGSAKPAVTVAPKEPTKMPSKPATSEKITVSPESIEPTKASGRPIKTSEKIKPVESVKPVVQAAKKEVPHKAVKKQKDTPKVNINFSDVPLSEILATIAQSTNLNIIGGEEASEKITLHLEDVPLDSLFDIILKSTNFGYVREGKIIRIVPKKDLPTKTAVFRLRFASAEKVMEAIAHLLSQKGKVKSFSNFSQNTPTNLLVVTDVAESIQAIKALIKKLDKKVKQVMIEVKFCEVTLDKDDELGIDWVVQASVSGATGYTTLPLGTQGQNIPEAPIPSNGTVVSTSGIIGTLGTVDFSSFRATLHALDSKTKVKIIATPQVAARSGQPARIIIGDRIPIPTYERSAETGSMEVTGYEQEDVGIVLEVTPFVNSDNSVTLSIHPEVSEITGYTGPNDERPIVSTREVTTVFSVLNGETIVLGGLKKQTVSNTVNKVPFLGNIPLLGRALFTYKDDSDERRELLLFITPRVLDDPKEEGS